MSEASAPAPGYRAGGAVADVPDRASIPTAPASIYFPQHEFDLVAVACVARPVVVSSAGAAVNDNVPRRLRRCTFARARRQAL